MEFKIFPDIGILHLPSAALPNNCMAQVTILCNNPSVSGLKGIIMTSEASIGFKVTDMFGIKVVSNLHFRESILAVCQLH
jgi:hypothetical protein